MALRSGSQMGVLGVGQLGSFGNRRRCGKQERDTLHLWHGCGSFSHSLPLLRAGKLLNVCKARATHRTMYPPLASFWKDY